MKCGIHLNKLSFQVLQAWKLTRNFLKLFVKPVLIIKYAAGSDVISNLLYARPTHRWLCTHRHKKDDECKKSVHGGAYNSGMTARDDGNSGDTTLACSLMKKREKKKGDKCRLVLAIVPNGLGAVEADLIPPYQYLTLTISQVALSPRVECQDHLGAYPLLPARVAEVIMIRHVLQQLRNLLSARFHAQVSPTQLPKTSSFVSKLINSIFPSASSPRPIFARFLSATLGTHKPSLFATARWHIWTARNKTILGEEDYKSWNTVSSICAKVKEFNGIAHLGVSSHFLPQRMEKLIRWIPLGYGWIKVNTDGAVRFGSQSSTSRDYFVMNRENGWVDSLQTWASVTRLWLGGFAANLGLCNMFEAEL
ncbi:hypothetical protein Scep_027619 [Stephania cephalantha]|uniref:Uncharacterized protein n=1 Tax=Stephania cephalantha TaxID=152367 RepID=A0AAP0EBQ2_9MAGN